MQKVSYMGDGSTTEFNFNFPYYESTDIIVTKNNVTATGYTLVGTAAGENADIPYTGGKVVFETAPTSLDCITIARSLPLNRSVDYQPTAKIDPTTLNQDMNYMLEVLKDFNGDLQSFATQYSEIVDKESTTNLLTRIEEIGGEITNVSEKIDDFNDEISAGRIMYKDDFYSHITNCIVQIPQDIKLELNNGTLTLKAGSKIYIPNGTDIFDVVVTQEDLSITGSNGDYSGTLFYKDIGDLTGYASAANSSGTTAPSGNANFYNTTTNTINRYNGGTKNPYLLSLPLCNFTVTNSTIVSIDKIFNGFGYIGGVFYVLPGVSGLIPDGRNDDGSLKNTLFTITEVKTEKVSGNGSNVMIRLSDTNLQTGDLLYNKDFNYNYVSNYNQNNIRNFAVVGTATYANSAITSITFKNTFSLSLT